MKIFTPCQGVLADETTTDVVVPVVRVVVIAKNDANVVRIIVPGAAANPPCRL